MDILVDTGCAPSVVSASFARQHALNIDSTRYVAEGARLAGSKLSSTVIERVQLGDLAFLHVPVLIIEDELFRSMQIRGGLILGITELMFFDRVVFDYAGGKLSFAQRVDKKDVRPNFAVLDFNPVMVYDIRGEPVSGLVDTGSPYTYLVQSDRWDPKRESAVRSEERSWGPYTRKVSFFRLPASFGDCLTGELEFEIGPNRSPPHRFRKESVLGNTLWGNRALVIDFRNRHICFERR